MTLMDLVKGTLDVSLAKSFQCNYLSNEVLHVLFGRAYLHCITGYSSVIKPKSPVKFRQIHSKWYTGSTGKQTIS